MTTALSIQSAEMSKGVKPSLRTRLFSKAKMLKAAKAVLPVAVLAAAFPEVAMATTTGIGKQVKRFWPAHFFVLFYTIHLAVLGILAG